MFKFIPTSTALGIILSFSSSCLAAIDTNTVVAKVNNNPIYMSDLAKIEGSLSPEVVKAEKEKDKEKFFANIRDRAIDMKLLGEASKKANLEKDPELQQALLQIQEQMFIQAFINKQLEPLVNDKAIKDKYDEFLKKFPKNEDEVKVRHIMVKEEAQAKQIIQDLKKGADFQKLAREKSLDKATATEGGDLGFMRKGDVEPAFSDAAFALKPGAYTEIPVKTSMGWHIIKSDDRRKVKPPKFEEVKGPLGNVVFQEQLKKLVDQLRDKASIERFTAQGKPITLTAESEDKTAEAKPTTEAKKETTPEVAKK